MVGKHKKEKKQKQFSISVGSKYTRQKWYFSPISFMKVNGYKTAALRNRGLHPNRS